MSRRCELTGVGPMVGNNVSHSNVKTKRRFLPSLKAIALHSEALGQSYRLRISNAALRTLEFTLDRSGLGPLLGSDNNTFDNVFTVLPDGADLSLSKQKLPALVAVWPGVGPDDDSRMTSTIRVRNNGPRAATGGVQVVDVLAVGEEFVSGGNADWSCSVSPASWSAGCW